MSIRDAIIIYRFTKMDKGHKRYWMDKMIAYSVKGHIFIEN